MKNVSFIGFENPVHERELRELYEEWGHIIPPWILTVVFYSSQKTNTRAFIDTYGEYLSCNIHITPLFFDNAEHKRVEVFKHELVHSFISELTDWTRDKFEILSDDKTFNILNEELRLRMERVVQWNAKLIK